MRQAGNSTASASHIVTAIACATLLRVVWNSASASASPPKRRANVSRESITSGSSLERITLTIERARSDRARSSAASSCPLSRSAARSRTSERLTARGGRRALAERRARRRGAHRRPSSRALDVVRQPRLHLRELIVELPELVEFESLTSTASPSWQRDDISHSHSPSEARRVAGPQVTTPKDGSPAASTPKYAPPAQLLTEHERLWRTLS
jgi:hypothetical protein